jgi:acetyl-CoA C-acetyltransferase
MNRVAIAGVGVTKFGELWDHGFRELMVKAGVDALNDANMDGKDIEAIFGGTMSPGRFVGQEHVGGLIADQSGLNPIPSTRVEAACASGGVALRQGYMAVAGGHYDIVIVGGVEKMTDVLTEQAATTLGGAGDQEWEMFIGATFPAVYAMMTVKHMNDFGTTEEQLAAVAVKNHENASKNPKAQFQYKVTIEQVLDSPMIAWPLRLLDCSPLTDGAAAVILTSEKVAKKYTDTPVWIEASSQASDTLALHDRKSLTSLKATQIASTQAFKQAGLKPTDIQVAELHDCFTIGEIMAVEDLGFVKKGEGGKAIADGRFNLGSKLSTNTSGGLKGCGHPVGATGVKQAVEIVEQLRGTAGDRQVDAEIGLTHNVGGSGATAVVHILRR